MKIALILTYYRIDLLAVIDLRTIVDKVGLRTLIEIIAMLMIIFLFKGKKRAEKSDPPGKKTPKEGLGEHGRYRKPIFQKQKTTQANGIIEGFELQTFLTGTHIIDLWEVVDTNAIPPTRAVLSVVKAKKNAIVIKKISRAVNLLSGFSHPNIVSFLGEGKGLCSGEWEQYKRYGEEIYYVISDYIQGGTLKERLAGEENQKIALIEALYIAIDVLYSLEFLSSLNLVHRNLKPANIMVDRRGVAKITGFHLLKEVQDNSLDSDKILTREGVSLGTPEYMSLEQCRDAANVDTRSDIYSLGVVLYQMLTGTSPFRGKNLNETFKNIKDRAIEPLQSVRSEVPEELETIVTKAIDRNVDNRYQSPTEFRRALEALF